MAAANALWAFFAGATLVGCAKPCAIAEDDTSTGLLSLVGKTGAAAEADLASNVSKKNVLINRNQYGYSIAIDIHVAGATPAYASLSIRTLSPSQNGLGTLRLENLDTASCVCFGPDCAAFFPTVECANGLEGTIAISKAEGCEGANCTEDFVADVTILERAGNLSGAIHIQNHTKYPEDEACGKPIH